MSDAWGNFGAALLGGGLALAGVVLADYLDRLRAQADQATLVRRFLMALLDEIETVFESYQEDIGGTIEGLSDGDSLNFLYPNFGVSLPIYHGNLGLVLHVADRELRRKIVSTCTTYASLMDCFKMNNSFVEELESVEARKRLAKDYDQKIGIEVAKCQQRLDEYAKTIRKAHDDWKAGATSLRAMLRDSLKLD